MMAVEDTLVHNFFVVRGEKVVVCRERNPILKMLE